MFCFFINNVVIWSTQTEHLNLLMIKMRASTSIAFVLISTFLINAQQIIEYAPKDNIKSIKLFALQNTRFLMILEDFSVFFNFYWLCDTCPLSSLT